jgi:DtxR family Mn-dependent transcriptional regulator
MVSEGMEQYLDVIYHLEDRGLPVTTSALAENLGISRGSVSEMLRKLAERGLVHHEPYGSVHLTGEGRQRAQLLSRRQRLWEVFLLEHLGLGWDQVFAEACRLEHATSELVTEKLAEFLGHPAHCPHGYPIPLADGESATRPALPSLADLAPGQKGQVACITGRSPEVLRYLTDLGLVPGAVVEVEEKAPFGGPITLRVGETSKAIALEIASTIMIEL